MPSKSRLLFYTRGGGGGGGGAIHGLLRYGTPTKNNHPTVTRTQLWYTTDQLNYGSFSLISRKTKTWINHMSTVKVEKYFISDNYDGLESMLVCPGWGVMRYHSSTRPKLHDVDVTHRKSIIRTYPYKVQEARYMHTGVRV